MRKLCAVVLCAWLVAPGAGACGMTSKLTVFEPVAGSVPTAQADGEQAEAELPAPVEEWHVPRQREAPEERWSTPEDRTIVRRRAG